MALETNLKMAIVDISLRHLLRTKRQSSKRTANKIIDLCHTLYPGMPALSEHDPEYQNLITLIKENNGKGIRDWITQTSHLESPS